MTGRHAITWKTYALCSLFWLPVLSGVVSRLTKQSVWFADYGATACAAEKWLQGAPIYDPALSCPGITLSAYIYHPWIAQLFSMPLSYLGQDNLRLAYAVVFASAVLSLIWFIVGRRSAAPRRQRAWFGAFIVGSAVYWGNLAVLAHALIAASATFLRRWPIILVGAIAAAMVLKPLFITFSAIFLLLPRPLWQRIAYTAATAFLGGLPSLLFLYQGGEMAREWSALVSHFVLIDRNGDAFLGWVAILGGDVTARWTMIAYVAFAGLVTACMMVLAEALDLDLESRVMLGLSLGVLLNPRLMGQDFWLMGPGILAVAAAVSAQAPRLGGMVERAILTLCVVALIGNLADLADYLTKLVVLSFVVLLIAVAGWAAFRRRAELGAIKRSLMQGAQT
jgi:hypothetical protein